MHMILLIIGGGVLLGDTDSYSSGNAAAAAYASCTWQDNSIGRL
jgi:hypothetical protein